MTEHKHTHAMSVSEIQAEIDATEHAVLAVADLVPWDANPRKGLEKAAARLVRTVGTVGWGPDILVQKSTNRIIGGHVRRLCAIQAGLMRVPCKLLDVNDERAGQMALADNQASSFAEWDDDALADLLVDIDADTREALGWDIETEVEEMDERERPTTPVSDIQSEFWIMVKGPLSVQPDALELMRETLEEIEGITVNLGIVQL